MIDTTAGGVAGTFAAGGTGSVPFPATPGTAATLVTTGVNTAGTTGT